MKFEKNITSAVISGSFDIFFVKKAVITLTSADFFAICIEKRKKICYTIFICDCEKEWIIVLTLENHLGTIGISEKYLYSLVKHTVSTCYGVSGLGGPCGNRPVAFILKNAEIGSGRIVDIDINKGKLTVGVHITVIFGVNIAAVTDSLAHKLRYVIEQKTGLEISRVTVYIDGMTD